MRLQLFGKDLEIDESFVEGDKEEIRSELEEYLAGKKRSFELTVEFPNSFTGKVMKEMIRISYGETRTYGEIARKLDSSPIAVGQACGSNPVPVIVPCHRIVGKDSIGGYQYSSKVKEKLLDLESQT